ncbi:MAG: hypothetical protein HQL39_03795 [Alphaproteobacteria bacterium]|nr:hypothetical protein [Alphaproteobacteria bacterium]
MSDQNIFATLRGGGRLWAVAAIHGDVERLAALHAVLAERIGAEEPLVYLGNYFGRGQAVRETVEELLVFRRRMMARPGAEEREIVFLRGAQEEMWQKLLQLQFAPNPSQVLQWMVEQGVGATIAAYGGDPRDGFLAAREGILAVTRWTANLRQSMRGHDGHMALMTVLKHAAFTDDDRILFVHGGLDPARPLSAQSDSFWWGAAGFAMLTEQPYGSFRLVVRGSDRRHGGIRLDGHAFTLDGGCGFGGPLCAACFDADGNVLDVLEA